MKRKFLILFIVIHMHASNAAAVTIITNFIGGSAPANAAGGGNLVDIFNAAAHVWELACQDPYILQLDFGWAPTGTAGMHFLVAQSGTPNRETAGTILFDNSQSVAFFLDPTPLENEEYLHLDEGFQDFGGGLINVALVFSNPSGDALGRCDLFSAALHEIGHALGISNANVSFIAETADGFIDVADPLPFAGSAIPLALNHSGVTSHFDAIQIAYGSVMAGINWNERRIPSTLDILANAQLSGFQYLNLNLLNRPAPTYTTMVRTGRESPSSQRGSTSKRGH